MKNMKETITLQKEYEKAIANIEARLPIFKIVEYQKLLQQRQEELIKEGKLIKKENLTQYKNRLSFPKGDFELNIPLEGKFVSAKQDLLYCFIEHKLMEAILDVRKGLDGPMMITKVLDMYKR